jgi:hypothetical protein
MKYAVLLCSVAVALSAPRAFAGDAAAEALFRAGREAAERGDDATACARFEESHRIEPAAGTVLNLALCYERRGQVASAWQRLREARERLPPGDERVALVDSKIAALEARLPRLTLRVSVDTQGQNIVRDGQELGAGSLGVAVPVDPGVHRVELRAPGRAASVVTVSLAEGENKELTLEPGVVTSTEQESSPVSPVRSSPNPGRTAGFVIGGVGVAGIATGLVAGAIVLDRKSTVENECHGSACTHAGVEAADSGRTWSTVSTVACIAGAAAVGVGAYLVLSSKPSAESARLGVEARPGGSLLSLQGAF